MEYEFVDLLPQGFHNTMHMNFQYQDQDSSSTQSTGRSYSTAVSSQSVDQVPIQYGNSFTPPIGSRTGNKTLRGLNMSPIAIQNFSFRPLQPDHNRSITQIPFQRSEPFFGGTFQRSEPYFGSLLPTTYEPRSTIQDVPRMRMAPRRVPLPLDQKEEEPIYVNAKQFPAIVRRRHLRAKHQALNKLVKNRKPYLHESRHLHAMRRARASSGRFLNTKTLQESSKHTSSSQGLNVLNVPSHTQLNPGRNVSCLGNHRVENYRHETSTTPYFDRAENYGHDTSATPYFEVTSGSNTDDILMHLHSDLKFAGYSSLMGGI